MMLNLNQEYLREVVHGGAFFGAGGGGTIATGLAAGGRALELGTPSLASLEELSDESVLATISAVGTVQSGGVDSLMETHFFRALELFQERAECELAGFVASEVGAGAVTYGWRESAISGLPLVDAACNGRAHPSGIMGSLNLHRLPGYMTTAVAVGGSRESGNYLELIVRGNLLEASRTIRSAAAEVGGALAVIRNPVNVGYLRQHGAPGALTAARKVGTVLLEQRDKGVSSLLHALSDEAGGSVLISGAVSSVELSDVDGYTVGAISIEGDEGHRMHIHVCNEYIAALHDGTIRALFPDLITLIDESSCLPLNTGQVKPGQRTSVVAVPKDRLILSTTMYDRTLFQQIEMMLGVSLSGDNG